MYLRFCVRYEDEVQDIRQEVQSWADRYGVRITSKLIKNHLRFGFDHDESYSLFAMTFNPVDVDKRRWLEYQIINIQNERY